VLQGALGVALARSIEIQLPRAQGLNYRPTYQFSNSENEARRLLTNALERWPSPAIGQEFASLALGTRNETTLNMAAQALGRLTRTAPKEAALWTARAEIALARRTLSQAVDLSLQAVRLGDPSGYRALGVALQLRDRDPAEGARFYLGGMADADAPALYRYWEDLTPILAPAERAEWYRLPIDQRKPWLLSKWEWRASIAGLTLPERLAIHFRRLDKSINDYRRSAYRGARPPDALLWDSQATPLPFDDRGLLFVRHGEPDEIIRTSGTRTEVGKEAWIYRRLDGGQAVFEFQKLQNWADYLSVAPSTCDPFLYMYGEGGFAGERRYLRGELPIMGWEMDFQRGVFEHGLSLAGADPSIGADAFRCYSLVHTNKLRDELPWVRLANASRRTFATRQLADALLTETAQPSFQHPLTALTSVYAFQRGDSKLDVAAFLLIPADQITPLRSGDGVTYNLRLSLAIEDPAAESVQRIDTILTLHSPQLLTKGQRIRTAIQMPVDSVPMATIRLAIRNADQPTEGQILVLRKPLSIPKPALALSDLVVGDTAPGIWRRQTVAISPLPGHQLAADAPIRLFYEIYGLQEGDPIVTYLTIAPDIESGVLAQLRALLGSGRLIELHFEEHAQLDPTGVLQVERLVVPSLQPGRYTLRISVEAPGRARTASAETSIVVLEPVSK
jgi:hypothetical protein